MVTITDYVKFILAVAGAILLGEFALALFKLLILLATAPRGVLG